MYIHTLKPKYIYSLKPKMFLIKQPFTGPQEIVRNGPLAAVGWDK